MKILLAILAVISVATTSFANDDKDRTANTNSPAEREPLREGSAVTDKKDPSSTAFKKHRGDASKGRQTKPQSTSTSEPIPASESK
ncbi:hypothetical protein [Bdellovibrio sp. HCB274]|uniref:hypothetical protein n=1 Tax=Bdellovibrio sp. HCB274 TaxID=3394361 RepID=UPI0039B569A3